MSGGNRCGIFGSELRTWREGNQVWLVSTVDRIDGVINGSVHDGKAACGVDRRRLHTGRPDHRQQQPVPLNDGVYYLRRGLGRTRCETSAQERKGGSRGHPSCLCRADTFCDLHRVFAFEFVGTVLAPWRRRFSTVYTRFLDGLFPKQNLLNWE